MALHLHGAHADQHEHPIGISIARLVAGRAMDGTGKHWNTFDWVAYDDVTFNSADKKDSDEAARLFEWAAAAREPGRGHRPTLFGRVLSAANKDTNESPLLQHNIQFAALASGQFGAPLFMEPKPAVRAEFPAALLFAAGIAEIMRGTSKEPPRDFVSNFDIPAVAAQTPEGAPSKLRVAGRVARRGVAAWVQDTRSTWREDAGRAGDRSRKPSCACRR